MRCFGFLVLLSLTCAMAEEKGSKQLDFEGDYVEGVAKQPMDSLSQFADETAGSRNQHLYRKRKPKPIVDAEIEQSLREVAVTQ